MSVNFNVAMSPQVRNNERRETKLSNNRKRKNNNCVRFAQREMVYVINERVLFWECDFLLTLLGHNRVKKRF